MRGVAAPQRLRRVQRRVVAQRDERVLQRRARRARARGRCRWRPRRRRAAPPARPAAGCGRGRRAGTAAAARPAGRRARTRPAAGAASARRARPGARSRSGTPARRRAPRSSRSNWQVTSPKASGVVAASSRVCACARVRIRHRLRQPSCVSTSSVRWRPSSRSTSAPWIALSPSPFGGLRELHRAAQPVVVGQRERAVAELGRGGGQLVGQRGAVEEGEGGVGVELGVHACEHMFARGRVRNVACPNAPGVDARAAEG